MKLHDRLKMRMWVWWMPQSGMMQAPPHLYTGIEPFCSPHDDLRSSERVPSRLYCGGPFSVLVIGYRSTAVPFGALIAVECI
jgi:hypothetical protein